MGCGSAKVLQNGADSSSVHHQPSCSSDKRSSKAKRCKAKLFGYGSPPGALVDSLGKTRTQSKAKDKSQVIGRSAVRENPYHEVRLQHNKVRPSNSVYECSSAKQYPNENFRVRTTVSGTSRIRVTLSSDGSMLEIETERLPAPEVRGQYDDGTSDDSDGYVRLSPSDGCGITRITHAQVENYDDGRHCTAEDSLVTCHRRQDDDEDDVFFQKVDGRTFADRKGTEDLSAQTQDVRQGCSQSPGCPMPADCFHDDGHLIDESTGLIHRSYDQPRRRATNRQPTPVSSPMSPSLVDGFNYEYVLASVCADSTLVDYDVSTNDPDRRVVLSNEKDLTSEEWQPTEDCTKENAVELKPTSGTADVTRTPSDAEQNDVCQSTSGVQQASPTADKHNDNSALKAGSKPIKEECDAADNTITSGIAQIPARDQTVAGNGDCRWLAGDRRVRSADVRPLADGVSSAASGFSRRGAAKPKQSRQPSANNTKKKRIKFWLRKVSSENDKELRCVGREPAGGLASGKCLSFDSAKVLERRAASQPSPRRRGRTSKSAFVHCAAGPSAPAPSELSRSTSCERSNSSEVGSASSANPTHANATPTRSARWRDSSEKFSGSALCSDLGRAPRKSSRKIKVIGENTKQQIVEFGLMISNPVEHEVNYSIAADIESVDALDAVDESMELEGDTSETKGQMTDIEAKTSPTEGAAPTEEPTLEDKSNTAPVATDINVHRDFFNNFEDLYDDDDIT